MFEIYNFLMYKKKLLHKVLVAEYYIIDIKMLFILIILSVY